MDSISKREKNERLFKVLNADLVSTVSLALEKTGKQSADEPMNFICECGDRSCANMFKIKIADYRQLSRNNEIFMVIPGHEDATMENIVSKHAHYYVVQKTDS
jgi:hypothetical protein